MASRSRRGALKREQTIVPAGIMTPDESFNTITLDDEHPNLKVESFSSYQTQRQHQERERRSESLSLRSSRPPQQMPRDMREATMATSTVPDFSSLGLNVVGKKVSVLVQAINDLRQVGVDGISKKLPELVLVGDQSAGKSSLMGALAEIHLPRRDGRCTLCPTNIKTSEANTWECKVFLEQEWRFVPFKQGQGITQRDVTKNNPFPQWTRQEMEVKPFKTITTKSELEGVLRWAQIALLNHNLDYKMFVPGSGARCEDPAKEEMGSPAKFSPNTISVQISGPGLPALSFFDLPGIFQAAEDEKEQYLVKVFRNLARTYIERENALVICAVAMKTDPGNSSTSALITELRATDRCIGVLTMPDRLPSGRHEEYEKVLRGRAHVVGRGYFVTKQPSGDSTLSEPGYHKKAREEEARFFETDPLWRGQWSEFRSRCGTGAIQEYLSQAFAEQIARSMPSIAQMISARTAQIDEQLAHLPELPAANVRVQIDVQKHLTSFSNDVVRLMNGESVSNSTENFHSLWGGLCNQFQAVIIHIKPMIKLFHESDKHPRRTMEVIEIIDDDDDTDVTVTPSPSSRKRPAESSGFSDRGMKRQINDAGIPISLNSIPRHNGDIRRVSASPAPSSHSMGPPVRQVKNPFSGSPFEPYANAGRGFIDLGGIRDTINRITRPGVPNHNHPDVCNELCMRSVLSWKGPLEVFFGETVKVMHQELRHILIKHLGRYKETELFRQADNQLQIFLREFVDKQGKLVESLYNLETYKLYTINTATFTEHEQKELRGLKEQRKLTRAKCLMEFLEKTGKKKFTAQDPAQLQKDKKKAIEKISDEELGPDEFKNELDVAAYVRGYYLTAAQRFVDCICLSVHGNLFRDIHDKIPYYLEEKLGIIGDGGEEICRALMEEDDGVARRRAELLSEKEKLTKFAARLNQLAEETGCEQTHENVNTQQAYHPPYLEEDMDDDYS